MNTILEVPDLFQTIAEIAVAIAGFSGLVVAFRKMTGPLTGVQKYRLQILLALAFGAMFLSLLPELLLSFGTAPDEVWRLSSSCLLLYSVVFMSWWIAASLRIKTIEPRIFKDAIGSRPES